MGYETEAAYVLAGPVNFKPKNVPVVERRGFEGTLMPGPVRRNPDQDFETGPGRANERGKRVLVGLGFLPGAGHPIP